MNPHVVPGAGRALIGSAAFLWVAIVPLVASGHHAVSAFRAGELAEIEGELVSVDWRNPHISFTVRTTNEEGEDDIWTLEAGAIYSIERRGVTRDLFQPGDQIRAAGRPHSTQNGRLWLLNMLLGDGREVLIHRSVAPRWSFDAIGWIREYELVDAATQNKGLFRVWSEPALRPTTGGAGEQRPYREDAPRGPEGPESVAISNDYAARCEPMGMPGIMSNPQPFEFVDSGATIKLNGFSNNARHVRTIDMSDQGNPTEQPATPLGYSVGHWENSNTLVVQTTRIDWPFNPEPIERTRGELEIIERFTLSEDQSSVSYTMFETDLEVYTRPLVVKSDKTYFALGEFTSNLVPTGDCQR